jgi:hypothetical protein
MLRFKNKFPLSSLTVSAFLLLMLVVGPAMLQAQVNPPRPLTLTISSVQSMNFGSFAITGVNGGTVTISNTGIRTSSGDLFLTNSAYSEGIYTIDAIIGTSLFLMNGPTTTLTGSNGGSMTMTLGQTDPEMPFTTISSSTIFHQGASLTVGSVSANPPGVYTGTYEVIINHE